nr:hypothetical protein [Tanacetum cinerariifolium]
MWVYMCVQVKGLGTGWEETSPHSEDGFLDVSLKNVVARDVTRVDGGGDGSRSMPSIRDGVFMFLGRIGMGWLLISKGLKPSNGCEGLTIPYDRSGILWSSFLRNSWRDVTRVDGGGDGSRSSISEGVRDGVFMFLGRIEMGWLLISEGLKPSNGCEGLTIPYDRSGILWSSFLRNSWRYGLRKKWTKETRMKLQEASLE